MKRFGLLTVITCASLLFSGCDLDITNPNTPTDQQVLSTPEGILAVGVGMQGRLAASVDDVIIIPGLLAGEFAANSNSMANDREFQEGVIMEDNASVRKLWADAYQTIKSAEDVLGNLDNVNLTVGTKNGLLALSKLTKAIEFSILLQSGFQKIPVETYGIEEPVFEDRATVLTHSLDLLGEAETAAADISDSFVSSVLNPGFDLMNTIYAYTARIALMAGEYSKAATYASKVSEGVTSQLVYSNLNKNPLTDNFHTREMFGAIADWKDNAESGDLRVDQFFAGDKYDGGLNWPVSKENSLYGLKLWSNELDAFTLYRYEEMELIKAEAFARNNDLSSALTALNQVRVSAGLPNIPSTSSLTEILDEVLKQRQYELFATGLCYEDLRRFDLTGSAKVNWLPYPVTERDSNSNTPANP